MQRSSESIGAIAAALAKAQAELTNPEKSLIATIHASNSRESDQTFRYAALSSGLDIVRKTLGAHEIAAVQSTAIDNGANLIRLTTTLAHSSGEWLSSEWPVCAISETATPRRMGAALTYARRYALFTLVGIAGEDDLDASDLTGPVPETEKGKNKHSANGGQRSIPEAPAARGRAKRSASLNDELSAALSGSLRAELLREIEALGSAEEATLWAQQKLAAKNRLFAPDAKAVEEAFAVKLTLISTQTTKTRTDKRVTEKPKRATKIEKDVLAS